MSVEGLAGRVNALITETRFSGVIRVDRGGETVLVPWNPSLFTLRAAQARTSLRSPRSTYDPVSLPRRPCDART
jgi:hypothetical protein